MGIISVSRELAALGDETAKELAKLLGYRFIDRYALEQQMKALGIDEHKLNKYDERKPSFFASLSQDRDDYLHYLKTAIFTEALQGNCVFIGRGAGLVCRELPAHIRIFLAAPLGVRLERVKSYFHCDERRALQIIEHSDQDRTGFHRYFFDIDWREPGHYHLSLNTGIFHPAACAELARHIRDQIFTPEAEAQNLIRLKELILEQHIKQHIMHDKQIAIHFLDVQVKGSKLNLYGVTSSHPLIEAALEAARESAPEMEIHNEIQVVREYSIMS